MTSVSPLTQKNKESNQHKTNKKMSFDQQKHNNNNNQQQYDSATLQGLQQLDASCAASSTFATPPLTAAKHFLVDPSCYNPTRKTEQTALAAAFLMSTPELRAFSIRGSSQSHHQQRQNVDDDDDAMNYGVSPEPLELFPHAADFSRNATTTTFLEQQSVARSDTVVARRYDADDDGAADAAAAAAAANRVSGSSSPAAQHCDNDPVGVLFNEEDETDSLAASEEFADSRENSSSGSSAGNGVAPTVQLLSRHNNVPTLPTPTLRAADRCDDNDDDSVESCVSARTTTHVIVSSSVAGNNPASPTSLLSGGAANMTMIVSGAPRSANSDAVANNVNAVTTTTTTTASADCDAADLPIEDDQSDDDNDDTDTTTGDDSFTSSSISNSNNNASNSDLSSDEQDDDDGGDDESVVTDEEDEVFITAEEEAATPAEPVAFLGAAPPLSRNTVVVVDAVHNTDDGNPTTNASEMPMPVRRRYVHNPYLRQQPSAAPVKKDAAPVPVEEPECGYYYGGNNYYDYSYSCDEHGYQSYYGGDNQFHIHASAPSSSSYDYYHTNMQQQADTEYDYSSFDEANKFYHQLPHQTEDYITQNEEQQQQPQHVQPVDGVVTAVALDDNQVVSATPVVVVGDSDVVDGYNNCIPHEENPYHYNSYPFVAQQQNAYSAPFMTHTAPPAAACVEEEKQQEQQQQANAGAGSNINLRHEPTWQCKHCHSVGGIRTQRIPIWRGQKRSHTIRAHCADCGRSFAM